jgi:hypothetical protein
MVDTVGTRFLSFAVEACVGGTAVSEFAMIAILVAGAAAGVTMAFGSRVLLSGYLGAVRGMKVPEDPGDKIVTYPLA